MITFRDWQYGGFRAPLFVLFLAVIVLLLIASSNIATQRTLAVFSAIREGLRALDPELPTVEATLSQRLQASVADPRRWTAIVAGFAATAVVLAALGVFGLMSYVVRQRRREMGPCAWRSAPSPLRSSA